MAGAWLLGLSALPAAWAASDDTGAAVPQAMWEEPFHQPVFTRGHIRVMDVLFPGGTTSEFHLHEDPATYVLVQPGRIAEQHYGKPWTKVPEGALQRGQIQLRTDYLSANLHHRVRNIDTAPTQIFAVVNLSDIDALPSEQDAKEIDGVIDNPWFRIRKLEVPGASHGDRVVPDHDAILMQPHDGNSHVLVDGTPAAFKGVGGGFSYHPAGSALRIVNEEPAPRVFVLIEVKQ